MKCLVPKQFSFGSDRVLVLLLSLLALLVSSRESLASSSPDLFVSDFNSGEVSEVSSSGEVSTFASGLSFPYGLAFDTSGNLYVSGWVDNSISKITPGGAVSTFATGFSAPGGMAFDASGNLYVIDNTANSISLVTPQGAVSSFASGFSSPYALAFDNADNLYVPNFGNNTLSKVTKSGVVSTFASGFSQPYGLAFDSSGNLFVSNAGNGTISKVTAAGVVSLFASGLNGPGGMAIDSSGALYVANHTTSVISVITPAGVVSTFASGLQGPVFIAFPPQVTTPVTATQLQILLPGETAVPGSPSGKTGSPLPQTAGTPFSVTVNAVDANFNLAGSATNVVSISSSDPQALLPAPAALVNGSASITVTLNTAGTQTFTARDTAASNPLTPGMSASVQAASGPDSPPAITLAPVSQYGSTGGAVTFTAAASGTAPLSYQWYFDGAPVPGATNTSLTVSGLDGSQAGSYYVVASNSFGIAPSSQAGLYYLGLAPASAKSPQPVIITVGYLAGSRFRVDVSSSVANPSGWTSLTNVHLVTNTISFQDPGSSLAPIRFYRATQLLTPLDRW